MEHKRLREIVKKYLGDLVKFTIDFKRDDRYKLTILYEDEQLSFFEYKVILCCKEESVEFIKHKGRTLRREVVLDSIPEFELELMEFIVCEI
ncbi:hypothetical protein RJG79_03430 [Mycoplasmatota bacterium WC44]